MERLSKELMTKKVYKLEMDGGRCRGRHRTNLLDEAKQNGISKLLELIYPNVNCMDRKQ